MERQTYLRDTGDNDVKGIAIIEVDTDEYRVTENRDGEWCKPFWMPADELESHQTEVAGKLTSEQYRRVCEKAFDGFDVDELDRMGLLHSPEV